MIQLKFWNGFYEPFELGWWLQYQLEKMILQSPEFSHTIVSKRTGMSICGYQPHGYQPHTINEKVITHYVNDDIYGDGRLLHLTSNIK